MATEFNARSAAEIRDALLSDWRARYVARGEDLDITEGSDAYNEAASLALLQEAVELGAKAAAHRVLVRDASGEDLDRFAEDDGTARKPASKARRAVQVTGPVSTTTPLTGAWLSTSLALRFDPIDRNTGAALASVTTDSSGLATITVECVDEGVVGNLALGMVLTWSTAPTGFAATATVVDGLGQRDGEEPESDTALRQRLLERLREKPAAGNRAEWREWGRTPAGVGEAFVYPRAWRNPDLSWLLEAHGTLVVLLVRPSPPEDSYEIADDGTLGQGLHPSYTRLPDEGLTDLVRGYVEGEYDAAGLSVAEASRVQLRPAGLPAENINYGSPEPIYVDILVKLATDPAAAPWPFGVDDPEVRTCVGTPSTTTTLYLDDVSGIIEGTPVMVGLGTDAIQGGWYPAVVASIGVGSITLASPLPSAPVLGTEVRPDPGIALACVAETLKYFRLLGPGDSRLTSAGATSVKSGRYPRPTPASWPDRPFPSKVVDRVSDLTGVEGVEVEFSVSSAPTAGQLYVPRWITVERL